MKFIKFFIIGFLIIIITWFILKFYNSKEDKTEFKIITNLEIPCSTTEIIKHNAYVLSYNEEHEQANWIAYELTANELTGKEKRTK